MPIAKRFNGKNDAAKPQIPALANTDLRITRQWHAGIDHHNP